MKFNSFKYKLSKLFLTKKHKKSKLGKTFWKYTIVSNRGDDKINEHQNTNIHSVYRYIIDSVSYLGNSISSITTFLFRLSTFVLSILIIVFIYKEFTKSSFTIETFQVPESIENNGYNGQVLANELFDEINKIKKSGNVIIDENSYRNIYNRTLSLPEEIHSSTKQIYISPEENIVVDVPLMGTSLTINAVINYIKQTIGLSTKNIKGELSLIGDKIQLSIRMVDKKSQSFSNYSQVGKDNIIVADTIHQLIYRSAIKIIESNEPMTLANYHINNKQYRASLSVIQKVIANNNDLETLANAFFTWGVVLVKINNYQLAIEKFEKALELKPNLMEAWNSLGVALSMQEKDKEAIEKFKIANSIKYNIETLNNWGDALLFMGEYEQAIDKYKEILKVDSNYVDALRMWGAALIYQGKLDESIDKLKKVIEITPDNIDVWRLWAVTLTALGNKTQGSQILSKMVDINPENSKSWAEWGYFLYDNGLYEEAIDKYKIAIKYDSTDLNLWYNLGVALTDNNQETEAEEILYNADEFAKKYIKQNSNNTKKWKNLSDWGNILVELYEYLDAIDIYKQSTSEGQIHEYYTDNLLSTASAYLQLRTFDDTIAAKKIFYNLSNSIQLYQPYNRLMQSLIRIEDTLKVDEIFERLITENPSNSSIWNIWGDFHFDNENYEEASSKYSKAISMDSTRITYYNDLTQSLYYQQKYNQVAQISLKAIKLDPVASNLYAMQSWIILAASQIAECDTSSALKTLEKLCNLNEGNYFAILMCAEALQEHELYAEAIKMYKKALEFNANYVYGYTHLAECNSKLENYSEAIKYYQLAIKLEPASFDIWNNLAESLYKGKRYKESNLAYKKTLEFRPNDYDTYNNIASNYVKMKQPKEGYKYAYKAIKIERYYGDAYSTLAQLYALDNDQKQFFKYIELALDKEWCPTSEELLNEPFTQYNKNKKFKKLLSKCL